MVLSLPIVVVVCGTILGVAFLICVAHVLGKIADADKEMYKSQKKTEEVK